MEEAKLTKEYLSRFPTILQKALGESKHKERFLKTVSDEYADVTPVYRAIHRENAICEDDFICNMEEAERYGKTPCRRPKVEHYGVSVNEDKEQLIAAMHIPNEKTSWLGIASGVMKKEYGPADFVGEKTHHNWYLFNDSIENVMEMFQVEEISRRESNEVEEL